MRPPLVPPLSVSLLSCKSVLFYVATAISNTYMSQERFGQSVVTSFGIMKSEHVNFFLSNAHRIMPNDAE